jgi:predicted aminopeptidase
MIHCFRRSHLLLLLVLCTGLSACATLGYYTQSVSGQLQIMGKERSLHNVIADDKTGASVRDKLVFIRKVMAFAHKQLDLPDNGSYQDYADLGRPYVTWNVFAAPELSLQARQWCYVFVGCLNYRGYFSRSAAEGYADKLRQQGWDVFVGGVSAYSTLGWFRDPVLNTMLNREDWEIARLLFHELAHQKIYFKDGAEVNEAVAETVARIGLYRWLQTRSSYERTRVRRLIDHEDAATDLLLDYREKLARLYGSGLTAEAKLTLKKQLFSELQRDYQRLRSSWDGDDRFDSWMRDDLNNGKLVAVSTYHRLVPALMAVYRAHGEDLKRFYKYLDGLKNSDRVALLMKIGAVIPEGSK